MTPANIEFLETNRDCHTEIINAQTATKANKIKADLYRIMKQEFLPGYSYLDDCGSCLFDMTNLLYRLFDEWKEKQHNLIIRHDENGDALLVKANFPSHKEEDIITDRGAEPNRHSERESLTKEFHKNKKHFRR